jgi:peptidoglycan/xylan/chitin deacetylase (PgdA/CDA1 family)
MLPQLFLSSAQRRLLRQGQGVFTYHYLGTPPLSTVDPFLYVPVEKFGKQLAALRASGLKPATLDDPGAPGTAVITFDDGAAQLLPQALAPLAEQGFSATLYLVAGLLGGANEWDTKHGHPAIPLMDESAVRGWLAAGHEIGSHSLTHRNLARCSPAEAREELIASKKLLEDTFQRPIRHFCYPHGKWTPSVHDLAKEAGYHTACTTQFGVNGRNADRWALPRIFPLSTTEMLAKIWHRLGRKLGRR